MRVEPGTGVAVVVRRGGVVRIEQVVGDQGVDVELFALGDRRRRLDAARTRAIEGAHPGLGTNLWSTPPDERPLATIVADSAPGHDLLYPACTEREYELATGCAGHASCRAVQTAVAAVWGLHELDLHDPLNLWLEAGVEPGGALWWRHTRTRAGDGVELLAQLDLLAIVNPCTNDVFGLHRFDVRPIEVAVREATAPERERWLQQPEPPRRRDALRPARWRAPSFDLEPLARRELVVELPDEAAALLPALRAAGTLGTTDGEVVRAAFFRWWSESADVAYAREG